MPPFVRYECLLNVKNNSYGVFYTIWFFLRLYPIRWPHFIHFWLFSVNYCIVQYFKKNIKHYLFYEYFTNCFRTKTLRFLRKNTSRIVYVLRILRFFEKILHELFTYLEYYVFFEKILHELFTYLEYYVFSKKYFTNCFRTTKTLHFLRKNTSRIVTTLVVFINLIKTREE